MMRVFLACAALLFSAEIAWADGRNDEKGPFHYAFEEIAPGVWAGVRPDGPRFPVQGSTVFVVEDESVVVFDGGAVPVMADIIIEKIRSITDAPVTHVVISHWHGDHLFGAFRFAEEYPNVQYIAHRFTQRAIKGDRVDYITGYQNFGDRVRPQITQALDTGVDLDGETELDDMRRGLLERMFNDLDVVDSEYKRARVTEPTISFEDKLTLYVGDRSIELLFLGDANTAGDIVMWLPDERIVATGDMVVKPTPYAFNVPPRRWAQTLRNLNALDYAILVPGHGEIQRDTAYVDLIIETSDAIADQRDQMIAEGKSNEEIQEALDFSAFKERFTRGDAYTELYYEAYFENPMRAAAIKELSGEPMVVIGPTTRTGEDE
ncbi:MAG: MBL fold metallo-hydrolase [Pseudomonadota bacterium]